MPIINTTYIDILLMNSFHQFSLALAVKNKTSAMLILRDKTEPVARKILQKAGISVPGYSGRIFWQWVQNYIFQACRPGQEHFHADNDDKSRRIS
jgi:hypothetical protein